MKIYSLPDHVMGMVRPSPGFRIIQIAHVYLGFGAKKGRIIPAHVPTQVSGVDLFVRFGGIAARLAGIQRRVHHEVDFSRAGIAGRPFRASVPAAQRHVRGYLANVTAKPRRVPVEEGGEGQRAGANDTGIYFNPTIATS